MVNLETLYHEVLDEYYQNEKYKIPTIEWSKEYMLSRFGEYQEWKNKVIISRCLNTDRVSPMAIKSVIYHELLHQDNGEHNKEFFKMESKFPNFKDYGYELDEFLSTVNPPELEQPRNIIKNADKVYFGLLSDSDNIQNSFCYFNHSLYVETAVKIKKSDIVSQCNKCLVIWVVKSGDKFYIAGWSENCQLYSKEQCMEFKKFGYCDLHYQVKTKKECNFLLPIMNQRELLSDYVPKSLAEQGIISAEKFEPDVVAAIINSINLYSCEFENIGITDDAIESIMPYGENKVEKIIEKSLKETLAYRYLWYANLAVCKEFSYRTLFNQARALFYTGAMDEACNVLVKAIEFEPNDFNAKSMYVKTSCMLGKYGEAKKILNELDVLKMKDKELAACSKFLL